MGVRHWVPVLPPDLDPVQRPIQLQREFTCLEGVTGTLEGLPYLTFGQWTK